ncbi:hypothetical protein EA473_05890 [Natrarchaeobius chitinivorans]|uniref:Uncharacterized protein n=1 Tax=Natrarchaeobius chitinivorans TaxID=1679083 RepID=A0A3N6M3W1_NATCH|nr:hypothetical protein EA473_05890 [Natrarchaeobius chitinivorans]
MTSPGTSTRRRCRAHVANQFAREFGDDRNRAHHCGDCDSYTRLSRGSAAGLESVPTSAIVSTKAPSNFLTADGCAEKSAGENTLQKKAKNHATRRGRNLE